MSVQLLVLFLAIALIGLLALTLLHTAFSKLSKKEANKQLKSAGNLFFYPIFSHFFLPNQKFEDLDFAALFAQSFARFCYAVFSLLITFKFGFAVWTFLPKQEGAGFISLAPTTALILIVFFLLLFLAGECLGRMLGNRFPERSIKFAGPIASPFMILLFPATFLLLKLFQRLPPSLYLDSTHKASQEAKQELIEMIEGSNLNAHLDPHDKDLIESVMAFQDRIAREVMVPRVDIFGLSADMKVEDAAELIYQEGYSRTPVYKDTLDNITGVLMYKDVLTKYIEYAKTGDQSILQTPISSLVKNVVYTPETKKISHLLQEFRKQQVHLAIIVDEYGGTEGIVTIEDILEEIVGEIADEYDQEESLFIPLPEGGWLIDARMGILDIEEQLGIEIPQGGDYDTIGGFVFHETGTIPAKGFILKKPNFELEIIRSNDRRVEKLRIKEL